MSRLFTLVVALLFAPAALANDSGNSADQSKPDKAEKLKPKLRSGDLQVMAHYKTVNTMEIDLGNTAMRRAGGQAVKSYGEMLVKDHTESNNKLVALAKRAGETIPRYKPDTAIEKQQHAAAKRNAAELEKLSGAAFDREYLRMMVSGHERELAKIDVKIAEVQSSELADMLRANKRVLQHHADHARELQKNEVHAMR